MISSISLKLLYITHAYKPAYSVGGPILSVSAVAEELARRGHSITIFSSNADLVGDLDIPIDQPINVDGVDVWYFRREEPFIKLFPNIKYFSQSMGFLYSRLLPKVTKNIITTFDLVHTQTPFIYPTYICSRIAYEYKVPYLYQARGAFSPGYMAFRNFKKRMYIALFEKLVMNRAYGLVALTQEEVEDFRRLGVKNRSYIVPNGVHLSDYLQLKPTHLEINGYQIDSDKFVILFMARLHEVKGCDFLIDVFISVVQNYKDCILVMAGPDQHALIPKMKQKLREAGLEESVIFPGMISGDLKKNILARADLFCLPSKAEGFSMSILEALASGTPVIISPACRFPEVDQFCAGWIIDLDKKKWINQLSAILANPENVYQKHKQCIELVSQKYTWRNVVDVLEEIYQEIVLLRKNQ